MHSFTTIPPHITSYLIYLIHSTKKTLILNSHLKWTHLSILITIYTANTYINHISPPNTNFGRHNLIMSISSSIQMFSSKKKYYMNLVKCNTSHFAIIKTTPLFSLRSLCFHLILSYPMSIHIIEYQNIPPLGQFAVLIYQPFWGFGVFRPSEFHFYRLNYSTYEILVCCNTYY